MEKEERDMHIKNVQNISKSHLKALMRHSGDFPRRSPPTLKISNASEVFIDDAQYGKLERIEQRYDMNRSENIVVSEARGIRKSAEHDPTVNINCINYITTSGQDHDSKITPVDFSRLARCSFCFRRLTRRCCFVILVFLLYWASILLFDNEFLAREDDEFLQNALKEWVSRNEALLRSEYKERAETVRAVCDNLGLHSTRYYSRDDGFEQRKHNERVSLRSVKWEYMYWARKEGLLYCKVPKSGSSTWVYNLLKLAGVPNSKLKTDVGLHKMLRDYYPRPRRRDKSLHRHSLKLLVVRHPFDRILSAYRDKLESYKRDLLYRNGYYHKMYGRDIVRVHRNLSDPSHENRREPTWPEFVSYLVSTPSSHYDEHWRPIHLMCSPCVVKYDIIAKMETFSEDTQYVLKQLGLEDRLSVEWIHASGSSSTADLAKSYYSQIDRQKIFALYDKYRLDFELFDYDGTEHIQMTRT